MSAQFFDLFSDDLDTFDVALAQAVAAGANGEAALVERLRSPTVKDWQINGIIVALGEMNGHLGVEPLRRIAVDVASCADDRCAALVALTKRAGTDASDVLAACLQDEASVIRDYAALGLAVAGDGGCVDLMFQRLNALLSRESPAMPFAISAEGLSSQSQVLAAVIYLARHGRDEQQVVDLLRSRWDRLYTAEQDWLAVAWPACHSDGNDSKSADAAPDTTEMIEWLKHPLFEPIYS